MNRSLLVPLSLLLAVSIGFTAASPGREKRQATVTSTSFVTETVTVNVNINTQCAQLVNVTGACRRRRGMFDDEQPVVIILDDGLEDVERYFNPSAPVSVQTTPAVKVGELDWNQPSISLTNSDDIQSSQVNEEHNDDKYSSGILPRIYFNQIAAIFNNLFGPAVTTTVTSPTTVSVTSTSISTATFFISGCTPSPFPYATCPA